MRKRVMSMLVAAAAATVSIPSAQAADTTVHLDVDLAATAPLADCDVVVAEGSNGIDVLDAAVASACIDSYDTQTHPQFGEFVSCINDLCGAPDEALNVIYWAIYVDGEYSMLGVTSLSFPTHGSTLGFSYETWLTGLLPSV